MMKTQISSLLIYIAVLLSCGGQVASTPNTDDDTQELALLTSGDATFKATVDTLAKNRTASFRFAFDRGFDATAKLNVPPYATDCANSTTTGEQLFWNGEDASLIRLGLIGVANLVSLEAVTNNGAASYHVRFLSSAPGTDADARTALAIIARIESPALYLQAVDALSQNAKLSENTARALYALAADFYETKVIFDATGAFRQPNFLSPPTMSALLTRLLKSPSRAQRAASAVVLSRIKNPSKQDVDKLLFDSWFEVRAAAGALFWQGSDISPARQQQLLSSFVSSDAHAQMRLQFLRQRFGVFGEATKTWADEPDGFGVFQLETISSFVGAVLEKAPANADLSVLIAWVSTLHGVTDLVEVATDAMRRSTTLSDAQKKAGLLALVSSAYESQWNNVQHPAQALWRELAKIIIVSNTPQEDILAAMKTHVGMPQGVDAVQLFVDLRSVQKSTRVAALQKLAPYNSGFTAATFDVGGITPTGLQTADAFLLHAALDNGAAPNLIVDRVLGLAQPPSAGAEPVINLWGSDDVYYFTAFARAIDSKLFPTALRREKIVAFAQRVNSQTVTPQIAPGPYQLNASTEVYNILKRLESLSSADRVKSWREILSGPNNTLRAHLLWLTPVDSKMRSTVASIVKPFVTRAFDTCWQGHVDPAKKRVMVDIFLVPYVISPPTLGVDVASLVKARIQNLKTATLSTENMNGIFTVAELANHVPSVSNVYFGYFPYDAPARSRWENSANDVANSILAQPSEDYDSIVAFGYAKDFATLPQVTLNAVLTKFENFGAHAQMYRAYVHLMRGEPYDAFATEFRNTFALRWDLADAVRVTSGETAAMEKLLASVGEDFDLSTETVTLAAEAVTRAAVSESFRRGLSTLAAEGVGAWSYWAGNWSTGTLPLARFPGASLDGVLRGAAARAAIASAPNGELRQRLALFGTIACDSRLSPTAATQLAWVTLTSSTVRGDWVQDPVAPTSIVDMVNCIGNRTDIAQDEKAALGRAMIYVLKP